MGARRSPLAVCIAGTSSVACGPAVDTAELVRRVDPPRDAATVEARTGILSRRLAPADSMPSAVGIEALRRALAAAALEPEQLERIILVTSGGGDLVFPATANLVAAGLGLAGSCDCFDLNNACMGFLTALDIAARGIVTGGGPVGIVVVEFPTRCTRPDDPRPYLVFGDGAAAAIITGSDDGAGLLGSWLRNDGIAFGNVRLDNSAMTRREETIRFTASHDRMGEEAVEAVRAASEAVLEQAGLELADVSWVLPHQPNGALLELIVKTLGVAPERVVPVVHEVGSVGAAAIPISLDKLMCSGRLRAGDRVLMVGVGAGISYGAVLYQVGG